MFCLTILGISLTNKCKKQHRKQNNAEKIETHKTYFIRKISNIKMESIRNMVLEDKDSKSVTYLSTQNSEIQSRVCRLTMRYLL
jgi:hypothetical protein